MRAIDEMVGRDLFCGVGFERIFLAREIEYSRDFFRVDNFVGFVFGVGCVTFCAGLGVRSGFGSALGSGLGGGWGFGWDEGVDCDGFFPAACCLR